MRGTMKNCLYVIVLLGMSLIFCSCAKESPEKIKSELLPVKENPLVSFRILIDVGSANDLIGKEGLCQLTFSMLADG